MSSSASAHDQSIRAAFFDIDGTLTSFTTHEIPDSTIESLNRLRQQDIAIYLCTGRAPSHMDVVLNMLPIRFDGVVCLNGQYCFDDTGVLHANSLAPEDITTIIAWLDEHPDVVSNFCERDYVYFNQITDAMRATWKQLGKTAPATHVNDPHQRALTHDTFQISPFINCEDEASLIARCRNVQGVRWHPDFTDLIPADGGKDHGMARILSRRGWTAKQCIAFGDGGNDVSMLRYAGIGVAMGNATKEAKQAADYVTDDVDHDGILHALQHFDIL